MSSSSPPLPLSLPFSKLSYDLVEFILSLLPLRSAVVASAVCKQWHSIITHPSFPPLASTSRNQLPWFFLYGQNNLLLHKNRTFGFDPNSNHWVAPPLPTPPAHHLDCFAGSNGFLFATTNSSHFYFAPLLRGKWLQTSPLSFSRSSPLVGVFGKTHRQFIIVGGVRFVGGLVDIEDRLAVEIYSSETDSWELCSPLPLEFQSGNSSQWLTGALVAGKLFFVFGIYSGALAVFDISLKMWVCGVRTLRPPDVLFSFLLALGNDLLVLAGLCSAIDGIMPCLVLWSIDYKSLECREIGVMPRELLDCLFDGADDDEAKFESLKCVGLDGLVYVFNEDHHKGYPTCMCEVGLDLRCRWRMVPPLPCPANPFHKVIAFCSPVSFENVLGGGVGRD